MASDQQWALFFSGQYTVIADGKPVEPAILNFSAEGGGLLKGTMASTYWSDVGTIYLRLTKGPVPGGNLPGGYMNATIADKVYGYVDMQLRTWELVKHPDGSWAIGFNPTGHGVVIQFDGGGGGHTLQLNSAAKQRPDTNYPWNK